MGDIVQLLQLHNIDRPLVDRPLDWTEDYVWRKDGFKRTGIRRETRKGIYFLILRAWVVGDSKIQPGEEEGPSGLTGIQSPSLYKVFDVSMIHDLAEWVFSSLQSMSPLL